MSKNQARLIQPSETQQCEQNVHVTIGDDGRLNIQLPANSYWRPLLQMFDDHPRTRINSNAFSYGITVLPVIESEQVIPMKTVLDQIQATARPVIVDQFRETLKIIYTKVEEAAAKVQKIIDDLKAGKDLPFSSVQYLFRAGQDVVIRLKNGGLQGGRIFEVEKGYSFFSGAFWAISYHSISYVKRRFVLVRQHVMIHAFDGTKSIDELPIYPIDSETKAKLHKRGEKFMQMITMPQYMEYTGFLQRQSWWMTNTYNADGRVMIDDSSFYRFEPDYRTPDGKEIENVNPEMLFTTSARVKGYSMRLKMWGELDFDNLSPIDFKENAFTLLSLDQDTKDLIRALVQTKSEFHDLIGGKSGGTIFLLQGSPGTGKTLTAEAVAEILHKPLYMVSVGELGTDVESLEENLRNVLELATIWDAVLLIDEADIFMERRTNGDILRNSMVGIFLRLLEYYSGVLFLTTNRLDSIDEAFLSRVSLTLEYTNLSLDIRSKIWTAILGVQGITFPPKDITSLAHYELNGRQIKNAIKMSVALAQNAKKELDLDTIHFVISKMVSK